MPTCGNTFNAYLRTAFGSEGGTDVDVDILCPFVRDLGFPAIYDMFDDTDEILRRYKAKYGTATGTDSVCPNIEEESVTGPDNPNLNEDAVMRDIRAKFGI